MMDNAEVVKRYRGWKARQANARLRQARMADRLEINAIRQAHYDKLKGNVVEEKKEEKEEVIASTPAEESPATFDDFENLTNADMKSALEAAGFKVPKNTARVRLIELYKEHVGS